MAEIAISYAHVDTPIALELRSLLVSAGRRVWMDDARDDDAQSVGIPVGGAHWDVIEREFADAEVILVVDTQSWRESEYCQQEFHRCRELGKWILFWTEEHADAVLNELTVGLRENERALTAHARIASTVVAGRGVLSRWQAVLFARKAGDAEFLLSDDLADVEMTPLIRGAVEEDVRVSSEARRTLRRAGMAVVACFAILAVASVIAAILAQRFAEGAADAARTAEAAALIVQSQQDTDTLRAIRSAQQASQLDPGERASAAVTAAVLRDSRMRSIDLPPGEYLGAAWAADAPVVLVYSRDRILVVDTETGLVGEAIPVTLGISGQRLVAGADGTTAVFVTAESSLGWIDLASGSEAVIASPAISALAVSASDQLVWSTRDAVLHVAPYPTQPTIDAESTTPLTAYARSLDVDSNTGEVAVLDDLGWMRLFDLTDPGLAETTARIVSTTESFTGLSSYRTSITLCDGRVYGTYIPALRGVSFAWVDDQLTSAVALQATPHVCTADDAASALVTRGDPELFSDDTSIVMPDDLGRFFSVRDPQHARISFLSIAPARLLVVNEENAITRTRLGSVSDIVPLSTSLLGSTDSADLVDVETGDLITSLSSSIVPGAIALRDCDALIVDQDNVLHVDCDGSATPILASEGFRSIRTGSDGKHFVVCYEDRVVLVSADGVPEPAIALTWLSQLGVPADADISPDGDRLAIADVLGGVHVVILANPETPITANEGGPAGNINQIAYLPNGELLALGADGIGRRYSDKLALVGAADLGVKAGTLVVSNDRVYASNGESRVFDANSLIFLESVPRAQLLPNEASKGAVEGILRVDDGAGGTVGYLVHVPLVR